MTTAFALVACFFAGVWFETERKAASYALIFAAIMLAIGGLT
jgi:hypothetical protein